MSNEALLQIYMWNTAMFVICALKFLVAWIFSEEKRLATWLVLIGAIIGVPGLLFQLVAPKVELG